MDRTLPDLIPIPPYPAAFSGKIHPSLTPSPPSFTFPLSSLTYSSPSFILVSPFPSLPSPFSLFSLLSPFPSLPPFPFSLSYQFLSRSPSLSPHPSPTFRSALALITGPGLSRTASQIPVWPTNYSPSTPDFNQVFQGQFPRAQSDSISPGPNFRQPW